MAYTLHDRAGTLASLLYKAEKPSVRTFQVWRSVSWPWLHGLTSDLLEMIAISSGTTKFIFKSFYSFFNFSTRVPDRHLCRSRRPLITAIQCTVSKALDFGTLGRWSGI